MIKHGKTYSSVARSSVFSVIIRERFFNLPTECSDAYRATSCISSYSDFACNLKKLLMLYNTTAWDNNSVWQEILSQTEAERKSQRIYILWYDYFPLYFEDCLIWWTWLLWKMTEYDSMTDLKLTVYQRAIYIMVQSSCLKSWQFWCVYMIG